VERLEKLGLFSLELRKLKSDLIEVWIFLNSFHLHWEKLFPWGGGYLVTTEHSFKIISKQSRMEMRGDYFTQ